MKVYNVLSIIVLFLVVMFSINIVSAACIIQGYAKYNGDPIVSSIKGVCINNGVEVYDETGSNGAYALSWGGPADTCETMCGEVFVDATRFSAIPEEHSLYARPDNYPMNDRNMENWNDRFPHNVDLLFREEPYNKISINRYNKKIRNPIKQFNNNVITKKEAQISKNINKEEKPHKDEEEIKATLILEREKRKKEYHKQIGFIKPNFIDYIINFFKRMFKIK